jgi:predicted nucleotidyltransferase
VRDHLEIPTRFLPAYRAVQRLTEQERYLAAFIFGSVARGEGTEQSDFDVKVIVDEDNECTNINHTVIEGVKLDVTFISLEQLKTATQQEIEKRERIPMIAESLIIFDKTHELAVLREQASQVRPLPVPPEEYQFMHFMFYHGNNKAERNLDTDPLTALLVMHTGMNDFLHWHYRLQQRWWVSNKRMLRDLRTWDPTLAHLLEQFVVTSEVHEKFAHWATILDYILEPFGGRQPISENVCHCDVCERDLSYLANDE